MASVKRRILRTGILLSCLVTPFLIWRFWLLWGVDHQLARMRTEGLPTNGDEVNRWYALVPQSENAALVLTKAFELRRNHTDSRSNLVWNFTFPPRGRKLTQDQMALLSGYVEMNAAELAKADEALKLPASRYPIDCSLCSQTLLPHLSRLKQLTELYQYKTEVSLMRGDTDGAAGAIASILGLAHTIENEPFLISQLVRQKLLGMAVASLERSINLTFTSSETTNLSSLLAQTAQVQRLPRALIGERATFYAPLRPGEDEAKDYLRRTDWAMLKLIGYYEMDFAQFLFAMNKVINLAEQPPPGNLQVDKQFAGFAAASRKKGRTLSALMFSSYTGMAARENECLARLRLAVTALAVEQFRDQKAKLPDTLEELKPAFLSDIPKDPFTGDDVLYRQLSKGYVVYSVGRDLVDDGGKEEPGSRKLRYKSTYDITFTVER
jgi:hypothetical protein